MRRGLAMSDFCRRASRHDVGITCAMARLRPVHARDVSIKPFSQRLPSASVVRQCHVLSTSATRLRNPGPRRHASTTPALSLTGVSFRSSNPAIAHIATEPRLGRPPSDHPATTLLSSSHPPSDTIPHIQNSRSSPGQTLVLNTLTIPARHTTNQRRTLTPTILKHTADHHHESHSSCPPTAQLEMSCRSTNEVLKNPCYVCGLH